MTFTTVRTELYGKDTLRMLRAGDGSFKGVVLRQLGGGAEHLRGGASGGDGALPQALSHRGCRSGESGRLGRALLLGDLAAGVEVSQGGQPTGPDHGGEPDTRNHRDTLENCHGWDYNKPAHPVAPT